MKGIRNGISHGFRSLSSLYVDCIRLLPVVGKLLHQGISAILGFTFEENVLKHISNIEPIKVGECQYLDALILNTCTKWNGKNYQHPFVEMKVESVNSIENGHEIKSNFTFDINAEVQLVSLNASGRGARVELLDEVVESKRITDFET